MGKRQVRIAAKDLKATINDLIGREINIVTRSARPIFGVLKKADKEVLIIKNLRLNTVKCPIAEIIEIIYDKEAAY